MSKQGRTEPSNSLPLRIFSTLEIGIDWEGDVPTLQWIKALQPRFAIELKAKRLGKREK